mgnify:CR=1 FL=1
MKMKRMEMRDVSIGEYQFKIRPFGAKDALYIFGDVASILLPISALWPWQAMIKMPLKWKCSTAWIWTRNP